MILPSVVDPDATNALPVLRASDRPPPAAHYTPGHSSASMPSSPPPGSSTLSMSGSVPPGTIPPYPSSGPTGPSWHTPNTSYASISAPPQAPNRGAWIAVGAVALGAVALAAGIGLGWKGRGTSNAAGSSALAKSADNAKINVTAPPVTSPPPATSASAEPPSVSVDSLPGTNAGAKALGPVPHGAGRLLVTATPGWCNISVDGKDRGPTPVAGLDLPSGAHQIRCDAPNGKVKTTSVTVQEGAVARVKIALDD
jgi:hypothetical protein